MREALLCLGIFSVNYKLPLANSLSDKMENKYKLFIFQHLSGLLGCCLLTESTEAI